MGMIPNIRQRKDAVSIAQEEGGRHSAQSIEGIFGAEETVPFVPTMCPLCAINRWH